MLAVSNTSPISNLAIIDRLEILRERYQRVLIPPAVETELNRLTHAAGKERVAAALAAGWLVVERRNIEQSDLPLDPGEASAIRLAISVRADVLLLDERKARVIARSFGLKVAGVLGELLYAKGNGSIPLVLPEILKLRSEARFFIDSEIEHFILAQAGE